MQKSLLVKYIEDNVKHEQNASKEDSKHASAFVHKADKDFNQAKINNNYRYEVARIITSVSAFGYRFKVNPCTLSEEPITADVSTSRYQKKLFEAPDVRTPNASRWFVCR